MAYGTKKAQIEALSKEVEGLRAKILELRRTQEPQKVENYVFTTSTGEKTDLTQLFGEHQELFVVHNMGRRCSYCTLWADGFNGVLPHLSNRAAFVVSSPDTPEIQAQFAASRHWAFKMISTAGTTFAHDMGYEHDGSAVPGISVFSKGADGAIVRVSDAEFGPGDDYCQVWNLFDLLPKGPDGWRPKFAYRKD